LDVIKGRLARWMMVLLLLAGAEGCSGARHRRPSGPPPEYELPTEPDASFATASPVLLAPRDAGTDGR
jgi:hypothetical protein